MVKKRNRTFLTVLIALGAIGALFATAILIGGDNAVTGNISNLQLTENHRDMNCEAWNNLAVTRDGVKTVVGSGRQGFNPSFDTSLLSLTDGSSEVDQLHVQLVLLCDGNFIKRASATTVSGSVSLQLCGDPSGARTTCFAGQERNFQQISGIASSTETFFTIPIQQTPLEEEVAKLIYEGDISAVELERLFSAGDGRIFFKSIMFPQLTWTFNHPTLGLFSTTYNAFTSNDPIVAQYGDLRVVEEQVAELDADGDGFIDSEDGCINLAETFNGFQDDDGCPDVLPPADNDTDGDGILDDVDECVTEVGVPENNGCPAVEICPQGLIRNPDGTCPPVVIFDPPPAPVDSDGDGTPDVVDLCPFEVGTVGNMGCPEPEPELIEDVDTGTFTPTPLPPIVMPPEVIITQPTTTVTALPSMDEDETRTFIILILIIGGIIAVAIAGIIQRRR